MKLHWQHKKTAQSYVRDKRVHAFLFNEASLTRFIQQRCEGVFNIDLITESWCQPMSDETDLLSLPNNEITFIRISRLKCDNQTLVYARTVIPQKTLEGENQWLTKLGAKPLGDTLFNDETTYRTDMRYAKIPVHCELHGAATKELKITSELWGRQSLFHINHQPLLITEVFLPAILECSKN